MRRPRRSVATGTTRTRAVAGKTLGSLLGIGFALLFIEKARRSERL